MSSLRSHITMLAVLGLLSSCTTRDFGYDDDPNGGLMPVTFDSYMQRSATTRTTHPTDASVGAIDDARLQSLGFGVFAQHHKDTDGTGTYAYDGKGTGTEGFNFMYNEHLSHGATSWTYSPVKYWPNDNEDADADEGTATGQQAHHYVSFFAYAPYTDHTALPATPDATDDGIVAMTPAAEDSGSSYLTYRTSQSSPFDPSASVDLLWAEQTNLFKTKATGEGYVGGSVRLPFKHALSKLQIAVKGFFDHTGSSDASTTYDSNVDSNTRILIESVSLNGSPLFSQADMYLASRSTLPAPYWHCEDEEANLADFTFSGTKLNAQLSNYDNMRGETYWTEGNHEGNRRLNTEDSHSKLGTDYATSDEALADLEALPTGVTNTEVALSKEADQYWLLIPNNGYVADGGKMCMTVGIVYYVITYDERLTMNTPKYFSIVKSPAPAPSISGDAPRHCLPFATPMAARAPSMTGTTSPYRATAATMPEKASAIPPVCSNTVMTVATGP